MSKQCSGCVSGSIACHRYDRCSGCTKKFYNSADIKVSWNGVPLDGLAPDSFVSFSRAQNIESDNEFRQRIMAPRFIPFPGAQAKYFGSHDDWKNWETELKFPNHAVPRFIQIYRDDKKRENMKSTYKLTILYDNGKKFIVNGVFKHGFTYKNSSKDEAVRDKFKYSFYNKTSKALTDVEIPARDIAALTMKKANSILVEQYKPCARISGGAEKRENNNKQLKASK